MPKPHSTYNDKDVEEALSKKAREVLGTDIQGLQFMMLSGNLFEARSFAYSAVREWKGATKPSSKKSGRKPLLDATFAYLSVYLHSLLSYGSDFFFAYEEIKKLLLDNDRDDLWEIVEEKLPFVSLPPMQMFPPGLKSPIAPYYVIKQDIDLTLGELYPSVQLSNVVQNIKTRFFCFFSYEGDTAFAFFNALPVSDKLGFDNPAKEFTEEPTSENMVNFINNAETIKDLFVALITCHNSSMLEQFLISDYETLLNELLRMGDI